MEEYKKAVEVIKSHNEYVVNNADICEVAHHYTVNECTDKDIVIDDDDNNYLPEAQAIFDHHYKIITEILAI